MMDYDDEEKTKRKNSPYMKAMGDLKMMMKKKMIEDKIHKEQHTSMDGEKEEPEEKKMDYDDEGMDDDYKSDFMKGKKSSSKEGVGSSIMIALKAKNATDKKKKGKNKKRA